MHLKLKFCIFLASMGSLFLGTFSIIVYMQVRHQQLESAGRALHSYVEQTWNHLEQHRWDTSVTMPREGIYQRLYREGALLQNTFPSKFMEIPGEGRSISSHTSRRVNGQVYELVAFFDLGAVLLYLSNLKKILFFACAVGMVLAFPFSWAFARSFLRPFRKLSQKTSELDAEKLSFRFPEPKHRDEYGRLVRNFNSLLNRLDKSFSQLRRFAANASHELRTPLTVIRGEAEVMLRRPRGLSDYQLALRRILDQAATLQRTINQLLFFAQLERVEQENAKEVIAVKDFVSDTLESLQRIHTDPKKISLEVPNDVWYLGHRELFSSVVGNLLENAIKYSNRQVSVQISHHDGVIQLRIEDDGPGIPSTKKEEAFEPFNEVSQHFAGTRKLKSHGLGLSIVKACVEAARGSISLLDSSLGGLLVDVRLPGAL